MKIPVCILTAIALVSVVISISFALPRKGQGGHMYAAQDYRTRYMQDPGSAPEIEYNLKKTVSVLSGEIGSRGYNQTTALDTSADYIISELEQSGYTISHQSYEFQEQTYRNISVEVTGHSLPDEILIIGAHYDTVTGTPGADDNASGVAGLLELAKIIRNHSFKKSVRLIFFTLEEPPLFRSKHMGSYVYAQELKRRGEKIIGMICLEMIGYFTDKPDSQLYPLPFFRWFYPDRGNFIALVSNLRSRHFLRRVKTAFQSGTDLPVESLAAFSLIPGVDFSDHRSFWHFGYNALMVTDTAFYRNPNYHGSGDVPETLDYRRMTEVVYGLKSVTDTLAVK